MYMWCMEMRVYIHTYMYVHKEKEVVRIARKVLGVNLSPSLRARTRECNYHSYGLVCLTAVSWPRWAMGWSLGRSQGHIPGRCWGTRVEYGPWGMVPWAGPHQLGIVWDTSHTHTHCNNSLMLHSSTVPWFTSPWDSGWTLNPTRWAISLLRPGDMAGSSTCT